MTNKINIGCGYRNYEGYVNLDSHNTHNIDIVHDLNNLPLPVPNSFYDFVLCSHVLEDFNDPVPLLNELIRICKVGGQIKIQVPHDGAEIWGSLNHKRAFTYTAFKNFATQNISYGRNQKVKIVSSKYYSRKVEKKENGEPVGNKCNWKGLLYWWVSCWLANKLGHEIVGNTFIKYLLKVHLEVIFEKV